MQGRSEGFDSVCVTEQLVDTSSTGKELQSYQVAVVYCNQKLLISKSQQSTAINVSLFERIGVAYFSKAVSLVLSQCWFLNTLE